MSYLGGQVYTDLVAYSEARQSWDQCRTLAPMTGQACGPAPVFAGGAGEPHQLPDISVSAPFPWAVVLVLGLVGLLMLGRGAGSRSWE